MTDRKGVAMAAAPTSGFEPPDTIAALPLRGFEFSPAAPAQADAIIMQQPDALFRRLLGDQESAAVLLVARRVLDAFLRQPPPAAAADTPGTTTDRPEDASADDIAARVARIRAGLAATIAA